MDKLLRFKERYTYANNIAAQNKARIQTAYKYAIPEKAIFNQDELNQSNRKGRFLFDTTLQNDTYALASKLLGYLMPAGNKWAMLVAGSNIEEEQKTEVNIALNNYTNKLFEYIERSNLYEVAAEVLPEFIIGTAAIRCFATGDYNSPLLFEGVNIASCAFEESFDGLIKTVWRTYNDVLIRNLKHLFGSKFVLPDDFKNLLVNNINAKINIVEGFIFDDNKKNYTHLVTTIEFERILQIDEAASSPWIVFRYDKTGKEIYGTGLAMRALDTAISLNELEKNIEISAALMATPPLLIDESAIVNPHQLRIDPLSLIRYGRSGSGTGRAPLEPLLLGGNISEAMQKANEMRQTIHDLMHNRPLGEVSDIKNRSATEMQLRQQELAEIIAPAFHRWSVELIGTLLRRVIYVLSTPSIYNFNKPPLPPITIDGKIVDIEFKSALSLEGNRQEWFNLINVMQTLEQIGGQAALGMFNLEKLPQFACAKMQIPYELVKSEDEIKEMLSQAVDAAKAQQIQRAQSEPNNSTAA